MNRRRFAPAVDGLEPKLSLSTIIAVDDLSQQTSTAKDLIDKQQPVSPWNPPMARPDGSLPGLPANTTPTLLQAIIQGAGLGAGLGPTLAQ